MPDAPGDEMRDTRCTCESFLTGSKIIRMRRVFSPDCPEHGARTSLTDTPTREAALREEIATQEARINDLERMLTAATDTPAETRETTEHFVRRMLPDVDAETVSRVAAKIDRALSVPVQGEP